MAWMFDGVRPIIRFASAPTARGRPSLMSTATTEGSLSTMPRPRTYTSVLAVPRSTAMSRPSRERRFSAMTGISRRKGGRAPAGPVHGCSAPRLGDGRRVHKADRGSGPPTQRLVNARRHDPGPTAEAGGAVAAPAAPQAEARSGKKIAISRAADSGESEPCTRFSVSSTPKSPRIVPGSASAGLVVPIILRTTA